MRPYIIFILFFLAACGRESAEPVPTPDEPQRGGRLVVALDREPENLNPLLFLSPQAGFTFGMMHRAPVRMNDHMDWIPGLVDRWEWSEDGVTLDLHFRTNLVWSDGVPFQAQDVVSTYELCRNPDFGSPRSSLVAPIEEIEAVDDMHVRIRFNSAGPELLRHAAVDPLPHHITSSLDPAKSREWSLNRAPVVLGPFRLRSWTPGVGLILERNPHYFGEEPYLDEIEIKFVADGANQVLQLETGEVDLLIDVPAHDIGRLTKNSEIRAVPITGRRLNYLVFNLENPLFEDRRVRQAISHAIDRNTLVKGILDGYGELGAAYLPPLLWSHHDGIQPDAFDPVRAAQLLTEAGWVDTNDDGVRDRDGVEFEFEFTTRAGDGERENAATLIRRNLEEVGLSMEVSLLTGPAQMPRAQKGEFDVTVLQLTSSTTTDLSPYVGSSGRFNFGHFSDDRVDQLLTQALTAAGREAALPLWREIQEILHREKPLLVAYYPSQIVALRDRVRDATPSHMSPFTDIRKWWVVD